MPLFLCIYSLLHESNENAKDHCSLVLRVEVMASRNLDFPEEVLEEIMLWIPPKSLIRFKSVNKSWNTLINSLMKDPTFVNKHLHNIHNNPISSFLCFPPPFYFRHGTKHRFDEVSELVLFNDDIVNDGASSVRGFYIPSMLPHVMRDRPATLCYCNGIICVAALDGDIVLCNPAIMKCRTLRKPFSVGHQVLVMVGLGFGYDSRANDYKVVRIAVDRCDMSLLPRADLYSMKTDSWKEIAIGLTLDDLCFLEAAIFCKGVVYWSLVDSKGRSCGVLCFDTSDDIFCRITLPGDVQNLQIGEEMVVVKIAAWNESVVLFSYRRERGAITSIQVWVKDDCFNGVNGSCSWIKKLIIGPLEGVAKPWTFWKNDELVMEGVDGGLFSYNLKTKILRNIATQGADGDFHYRSKRWVLPYVRSLVSVQAGEKSQ